MDFQGNYQPESGKQIVSQFLLKSLHIILDSRIPSLRLHCRSGELSSASRARKSDRWFNMVLGDRPAALENLNICPRNVLGPMIIDIILVHEGPGSTSVNNLYSGMAGATSVETVIERWMLQYESTWAVSPHSGDGSVSKMKMYKKSIILLRSLYSQMRLLPAYRIFRQLSSCTQTYNFDIIYKVSSFCEPFSRADEDAMKEYSFVPVEGPPGRLSVSVIYHPTLSDFKLKPLTTMPPTIIADYVGSPITDPLRSFPSSEKGVCVTSFPYRGIRPPGSAPLQRPHSWTSGFHKAVNPPFSGSPATYGMSPMSNESPSPPTDSYGHRFQNSRFSTHYKACSYDGQLSPPFSPCISASAPKYLSNVNFVPKHGTSETAPVTIPLPSTGRTSRCLSPNFSDPNRHSLPPLSLRSTKHDSLSQESPSGVRTIRKSEGLRAGELNSGTTNSSSGHKVFRDSRDDSGRFLGFLSSSGSPRIGFSRSSSRLSLQDDLDDSDFSCPFDVDDVDASDSHTSRKPDGNKVLESTHTMQMGKKSQDAAVGVLVHMLRTAPPLRQDPSSYSSHSLKPDEDGDVATASGFSMTRKTADALEELRGYKEMKDLLLSKSGAHVITKEEA